MTVDAAPEVELTAAAPIDLDTQDPIPVGYSLLWVGAHPDDEVLAGPAIYRNCEASTDCHMAVLTRGEGGQCYDLLGCDGDLGAQRAEEMQKAADCYNASLTIGRFTNFPEPEDPEQVRSVWEGEADPVRFIAREIRAQRPEIVATFHPDHGFTGHPEHRLVGRLTVEAIELAANPDVKIDRLAPYRPARLVRILNLFHEADFYWGAGPEVNNAEFYFQRDCGDGETCWEANLRCFDEHKTQLIGFKPVLDILELLHSYLDFQVLDVTSSIRAE